MDKINIAMAIAAANNLKMLDTMANKIEVYRDTLKSTQSNKKTVKAEKIIAFNPPTKWIKEQVLSAGTSIGNVHFIKKTDGTLRKMCYRLHVKNPSTAKTPIYYGIPKVSNSHCCDCKNGNCGKDKNKSAYDMFSAPITSIRKDHRAIDNAHDNITVLDCNSVIRDEFGKVKGRGAWKTIPLNNIVRIKAKNREIIIEKY